MVFRGKRRRDQSSRRQQINRFKYEGFFLHAFETILLVSRMQ